MLKKRVYVSGGIKHYDVIRTKPIEKERLKEEQDIRSVQSVLEERERKLRGKREEEQRKHDEKLLADFVIFQQQLQDGQGGWQSADQSVSGGNKEIEKSEHTTYETEETICLNCNPGMYRWTNKSIFFNYDLL